MSTAQTYQQRKELSNYIKIAKTVRALSTPELDEIGSADRFRTIMVKNFSRIGKLSRTNSEILNQYYFPMLQDNHHISSDEKEVIDQFTNELTDPYTLDNVDVFLEYQFLERLMDELPEDDDERIEVLDEFTSVAYSLVYNTLSVYPGNDIFRYYRDAGMRAARELYGYLDKERFAALKTDSAKAYVLVNSRYICAMLQCPDKRGSAELNTEIIETLKKAIALTDDPFYREHAPTYNWSYHLFRAYEFGGGLSEFNNTYRFDKEQLEFICDCSEQAVNMYKANSEFFSQVSDLNNLKFYHTRNLYLTNRISQQDYKDSLMALFRASKTTHVGQPDMSAILTATAYAMLVDQSNVNDEDAENLAYMYRSLIPIIYRQTHRGTLFAYMYYVAELLRNYVEVPHGESFESFCLSIMAAIHPMTYVHTLNVSLLSRILTKHLLELEPELFVGTPGYETLDDVLNNKDEILEFVYHAALCHDFGKVFIVEVIRTYGRKLLDSEFEIIKSHVDAGGYLLSLHEKTVQFVDVAHGHHKWHNNQGGYPEAFDAQATPYRTIVDIITCADCMDAATDSVGRSYKEGKTLDEFVQEIKEGSGTRYAPFLTKLLENEDVRNDLEKQLTSGRDDNYRSTYRVLKKQA